MAFVSGLMGPYMSPIPINASMGMLISLLVAFIFSPWLASHLLKGEVHCAHGEAKAGLFHRLMTPFLIGDGAKRARRKLWLAGLLLVRHAGGAVGGAQDAPL